MKDRTRERERSDRVDPMALARACRKPIVTAVHGITYTAGIEMMLAGDIVVAADDCRFSQLEPKRGIHATGGATIRFVERGGWGNAMYHLLTSDEFGAEEARRIGLVQEVVPRGAELARALDLAEQIAAMAPLAVQATKASSRRYLDHGFAATVAAFASDQAALANSEDAREGVRPFVERRNRSSAGVDLEVDSRRPRVALAVRIESALRCANQTVLISRRARGAPPAGSGSPFPAPQSISRNP
jgi:enoyl-CoA hydratase/carnithine racemase